MSFVLDPNKNRGYPSLPEIPNIAEIPFHTKPYPESLMLWKTGEYPHVPVLPDMEKISFHIEPYPESLMLQKTNEYPYAPVLPRKIKTAVSRIVSGDFVKKIYFGTKAVKYVYINGECIFSKMELD